MLTNMFYYDFYKPYLVKNIEPGKPVRQRFADNASTRSSSDSFKVLLNKSLKSEIVDYVRDVSDSVVGTKESSKNLVRDMTDFNKNVYKRGLDTAKSWIKFDLDDFANAYNNARVFLSSQKHSQTLQGFSERLTDNLSSNMHRLSKLGFEQIDGKLSLDADAFDALDEDMLNIAIGETLNTFLDIYSDSGGVLTEPLKNHMNFKGLGYYYNYKLGKMENDTFKIIESGMIIDKVV